MAHGTALCLLVALASVTAAPRVGAAGRGVSLTRTGGGLWTAPVHADPAGRPWHFLIDTGSSHTVLADAAARRAGLVVMPGRRLLTPAGMVEVGEAILPALHLGERVRRAFPVVVADLAALGRDPEIDGILGMDALGGDRVLIDLAAGLLTFVAADDARGVRGVRVPVRETGGRFVIEARVDGRPRQLVLDTGAEAVVVFDPEVRGEAVTLGTAGGGVAARAGRAQLSLAGLPLGAVPTVRLVSASQPRTGDGLLPATLFTSIFIDPPAGEVRLVPRR